MVEKEPGFFAKIGGIFDPGGDPAAIDRAADAVGKLSDELKAHVVILNPVTKDLLSAWSQGDARDAYEKSFNKFTKDIADYAGHLHGTVGTLHELADHIRDARRQAANFRTMVIIALAAGAAMAIWSFGTSLAAAAGTVATAEAGFFAMIARMGTLLMQQGVAMALIRAAIMRVAARMIAGMAISWGSSVIVKTAGGLNPLDPSSWSANDASNILLGGVLAGAMGGLADSLKALRIGRLESLLGAPGTLGRAVRSNALAGALGSGVGGALVQYWLLDADLDDPGAAAKVLGGILIGAGAGSLLGYGTSRQVISRPLARIRGTGVVPPKISGPQVTGRPMADVTDDIVLRPGSTPATIGMTPGDWTRALTGLPAGAAWYFVNLVLGAAPPLQEVQAPSADPQTIAPPNIGPPADVDRPPPTPSHVTVQARGDSLWAIAQRVYGDGDLYLRIAEANNLQPPYTIYRGQVLNIPPAPVPVR